MKIQYKKEDFIQQLPIGFINPASSERFLRSSFGGEQNVIISGENYLGVRCDFGFMKGEYFTGDQEPGKSRERGWGIQIWQCIDPVDCRSGWIRLPQFVRKSTTALIDLEAQGEDYWSNWSQHARRYRKQWLAQGESVIEVVSKEQFIDAYSQSTLKPSLRAFFTKSIHRYSNVYGTDVSFLVVKERSADEIIAGLMAVYDFDANRTFHPVAFITLAAKKTTASLGLIDYWVRETKQKGIRFLDLGIVWMPGDPPSWKGYSQFKMHFHPRLIRYPAPFLRFFWNRR
jgi:hypothetical protein